MEKNLAIKYTPINLGLEGQNDLKNEPADQI